VSGCCTPYPLSQPDAPTSPPPPHDRGVKERADIVMFGEARGAQERAEFRGDLPLPTTTIAVDDGVHRPSSGLLLLSPVRRGNGIKFLMEHQRRHFSARCCWKLGPQIPAAGRKTLMGPEQERRAAALHREPCCVPSPWPPVGCAASAPAPPPPQGPSPTSRTRRGPQRKAPSRAFEIATPPIAGTACSAISPRWKPLARAVEAAAWWSQTRAAKASPLPHRVMVPDHDRQAG